MAEKINSFITSADELVTPRAETRAGFIAIALEKNYIAIPFVEEAKAFKALASSIKNPKDLLNAQDLRLGLLAASGLSDKSLNYLTENDKTLAIKNLIEKFLEPSGKNFIDELIYRYLLTKGDSLGGKARNVAGTLGERKFLRALISVFKLTGTKYKWLDNETNVWLENSSDENIEKRIKAIYWKRKADRILILNVNVPLIGKNVDLCVLNAMPDDLRIGKQSIIHQSDKYVALGELKGGIDPAGADEHWKTANSALKRIRSGFSKANLKPRTFFIGAAIEKAMAKEIFNQLKSGELDNAANLTRSLQLTKICEWIINL